MGTQQSWQAMRQLCARRDGYRCWYCGVPTAATIEHLEARSKGGEHRAENLRIACPSCNGRKGDRPLADWLANEGWRLPPPPPLPLTVTELGDWYGGLSAGGWLASGSTNSRLQVVDGVAFVQVRAGKGDPWQIMRLGREDHPAVVAAAYDFLRRHQRLPDSTPTGGA